MTGRLAMSARLSSQTRSRNAPVEAGATSPGNVLTLPAAAWMTLGAVVGFADRVAPTITTRATIGRTSVAQRIRGGAATKSTVTTPIPAPSHADRLKVTSRPSASTRVTFADSHRAEAERAARNYQTATGSSMARKAPSAFGFPKVA